MVGDGSAPTGTAPSAGTMPSWPPPTLERIQGDLFGVASRAALASALLVLPLLFVVTRDAGFATLGPLADAWWVAVTLSTIGLAFALDAIARASRTLRRASRALKTGYSSQTVLHVLADLERDMGFLLVGARHYSDVARSERESIARTRVFAAVVLAVSGLWPSIAFAAGLLLAARGMLSPHALEVATLGPAGVGYLLGGGAYLWEEWRVRRARKAWFAQPRATDAADAEARSWRELAASAGSVAMAEQEALGPRAALLTRASLVVGFLAVVVALPVLTLVPASAVGPALSSVSAPTFESHRPRAVRAEAYRPYAVSGDPSVTPQEAGELLHAISFAGLDAEPGPGERRPVVVVGQPWIPEVAGDNPLALDPPLWGDSLFQRIDLGLTSEEDRYLARLADHPLVDAFGRLARAPALDAAVGRWGSPYPPGLSMATLAVPHFGVLRSAANARIAAAAHAYTEGRADDAEAYLAEVIAVGFLLADDGPTLLDNLVGYSIVEAGGGALGHFYRVSGRAGASAQLSRLREVADRSATMMRTRTSQGREAWVRALPELVLDSTLVRGVRWEYFINLATMAPCLNLNRMVFGTDDEYDAFVESARASLVRWPSEEPLFDLARRGWIGGSGAASSGVLEAIAGLYMSRGENSCASALRQIPTTGF